MGCRPAEIKDLSSNISPLPFPEELLEQLRERIGEVRHLPEVGSEKLTGLIAKKYALPEKQILIGNGTTEFIYSIPAVLRPVSALILGPTYSDYTDSCAFSSVKADFLFSRKEEEFSPDLGRLWERAEKTDLVFICNPNNPTGALIPGDELRKLVRRFPSTLFVVDESYLPFVPEEIDHTLLKNSNENNLIVLRSFSKIHAMPGLRLGWLVTSEKTARALREKTQTWNVNRPAQIVGEIILESPDNTKETANYISEERERFTARIRSLFSIPPSGDFPIVYPGSANFVLLELNGAVNAPRLAGLMLERKILIRDCSNFEGLGDRFVRISLKSQEMNDSFLEAMKEVLYRECVIV